MSKNDATTGEQTKLKAIIFDFQKYSIHDGPGIRTIVFIKGCPLKCVWCSNPESQTRKPQVVYFASNCINPSIEKIKGSPGSIPEPA